MISKAKKERKKRRRTTSARSALPTKLGRRNGSEAQIRLQERSGSVNERIERVVTFPAPALSQKGRQKQPSASSLPPTHLPEATTEAFAAIGHPQRARMLLALLRGPATYRAMQKTTKLKAGPLYHHINQLRLARLIAPRQRDLYELTRGGRNLALLAIAAVSLVKDARRRPLG